MKVNQSEVGRELMAHYAHEIYKQMNPKKSKFLFIVIDDKEFDAVVGGKIDFALNVTSGAEIPEKGDTCILMVPDDDPEMVGMIAVFITYTNECKVTDLPAHLFKEFIVSHPYTSFDEKVVHIVFEMDPETTLEINGVEQADTEEL